MENASPDQVYKKRIEELTVQLHQLKRKSNVIAWSRFLVIAAMIALFFYLRPFGYLYVGVAMIILFAVFLRLVVLSGKNNDLMANLKLLIQINRQEISIASNDYLAMPDGSEYLPASHNYAHDLDVFGRASLYQYINRTSSEQGHQALAKWLLAPEDKSGILERQEAAIELKDNVVWRQQLHAYGMATQININTQQKIGNWLAIHNQFSKPYWKTLRFVLPGIITTALLLHIAGIMPAQWFYLLVIVFIGLSGYVSKMITPVYLQLNKIVEEISALSNSIAWIEQQSFNAPLLIKLQQQYANKDNKASDQVRGLKQILDKLDYRLNPVIFLPLNTFLFWDLQQAIALEKWKEINKVNVVHWFNTLGQIEAVSTIATISFNHPGWNFPVFAADDGIFNATSLGHPLIDENKRVVSSFTTSGTAKLSLVTGSNMAGKSTFLRSVGINIVLAMMGSPVCAKSLTLSPAGVISSMRVTDNLEESTSTFYAELKKLKQIIEAVYRNEKVFLLLDEILRGTNSLDRHTGSKALIKQLLKHHAVGILATHDLELADLVKQYPSNIHNYHFDVQVEGEELYFDYKLKEGVCQSLNASILMKKIGIEL